MTASLPTGSGGLWIRIQHRFGARLSEWFVAVVTLLWGAVLLIPADTFSGPSWVLFRSLMSEGMWGLLMVGLGALRLGGLVVNGARKTITPWIRVVSAGSGFVLWIGISIGFAFSGVISTGLAIYPAIAVLELFNIYRAAHDVGASDAPTVPR
jgi:hypothetical protein